MNNNQHCAQDINSFVHLRVQSSYSMLESALTIEKIVEIAKSIQIPAICLSDRGNLFGSLEFALACCKNGVQPIHGAILNLRYHDNINEQTSKKTHTHNALDYFAEILLIAKDEVGYKNLLKLVSYNFIKNDRTICNHITFQDLRENSHGLIALSAYTEGVIGKELLAGNFELAQTFAIQLKEIFVGRFYFEITRHHLEKERLIEQQYIDLAIDLGIPLVATNNVLFPDIASHEAHDTLLCISAGVTKEHNNRKRVSNQCYFKSSKEMIELFADLPSAIKNTALIAQSCYIMAQTSSPMLPHFTQAGVSEEEMLRIEAKQGLLSRLKIKFTLDHIPQSEQETISEVYFKRLDYELNIICKMDFSGYFLIVSDFIKWSKKNSIAVGPGRGSGAGSMVAWCLFITDLDPIKFGLLFERFLNPERISMPDFDIDFCQEKREEVIHYVRTKYGNTRVGQIITFGKLQAKAVIKDVSRVLGLPYKYADYLTELIPFNAVNPITLSQAIEEVAELKQAYNEQGLYNLVGENSLIKQVLEVALKLEGLHRHVSVHAAGVVIAGKDLIEVVPLYQDMQSDMLVVQYSMKYAELAGLMKFDFLGLQTLTLITKCLELLKKQGKDINWDNISTFDDPKTYAMLSQGQSTGVFQFESVGMKDTLKKLRPDSIGDLIALGALYRPGPMENIPVYIACKHKLQTPDYLHPLLKPILEETYGVIIYQEQVLEIAKILAGYSLGSADLLRRAMGKKVKAEMDAQEEIFIKGAKANNIPENQAKEIFATVAKFAGYGFNKAHASAYGVISYQTAYLKANFPAEFLVAFLNLELNNNDKINLFMQEAKQSNINVIPPDINKSFGYFTIYQEEESSQDGDKKYIIYALGAIKNVTVNFAEIVTQEREKNGPFTSIINFIERIPLKAINRRLIENLIKAGCFDSLHQNRNELLFSVFPGDIEDWMHVQLEKRKDDADHITDGIEGRKKNVTPRLMAYANTYHAEQNSKQFSLIKVNPSNIHVLTKVDEAGYIDLAFQEFEVLGIFIKRHPLSEYQQILTELGVLNSLSLAKNLVEGMNYVKIAGVIQKKDTRMSGRGRFVTIQLSDQYGIFDLTIFSEEVLKNHAHILNIEDIIIANCEIFKDQENYRLTAKSFSSINEIFTNNKFDLTLKLNDINDLTQVIKILNQCKDTRQSNASIILCIPVERNFIAKIKIGEHFYLQQEEYNILKQFT